MTPPALPQTPTLIPGERWFLPSDRRWIDLAGLDLQPVGAALDDAAFVGVDVGGSGCRQPEGEFLRHAFAVFFGEVSVVFSDEHSAILVTNPAGHRHEVDSAHGGVADEMVPEIMEADVWCPSGLPDSACSLFTWRLRSWSRASAADAAPSGGPSEYASLPTCPPN